MCHQINQHEERGWISLQRQGLSARQLSNGRAFWRCFHRWGRHESTQSLQSRRLRASFTEHRRQREVGRPRASHQHKSDACEAYGCVFPIKKRKIMINHWILGHQGCSDKAIYHWDWGQALHANYRCIALTENLQGTHGFLQSNAVKVGNDPPLWLISHDVLS